MHQKLKVPAFILSSIENAYLLSDICNVVIQVLVFILSNLTVAFLDVNKKGSV